MNLWNLLMFPAGVNSKPRTHYQVVSLSLDFASQYQVKYTNYVWSTEIARIKCYSLKP